MAAGDENVMDTNASVGGVEEQRNGAAQGMAVDGEVRSKINMNKYVVYERESGEVRSEFDLLAGVAARKHMTREELMCVDIRVSTSLEAPEQISQGWMSELEAVDRVQKLARFMDPYDRKHQARTLGYEGALGNTLVLG